MRVYKFRGKSFETGEYVYGDLIQGDNGVYIKRWEDGVEVEVDNDTIAQFSEGYDLNGEELYEGDVLEFDYNGIHYEYKVGLRGFAVAKDGCYIPAQNFKNYQKKNRAG
ncbi:MAG: hypothetical protein IKI76_02905 [Selenomonadaceae bacterium]|nr:hypothetical protein [Selenomonadaceae bacterium]